MITYRPKSAVRDVAKALGYSPGPAGRVEQGDRAGLLLVARPSAMPSDDELEAIADPEVRRTRPPSCRTPRGIWASTPAAWSSATVRSIEVCPVEWGRMPDRTVLQWDKDDCAAIGLVKFDLLGLGMLSALHYCFELIERCITACSYELAHDPEGGAAASTTCCARADSIGVFQVESRAQMATLPRLQAAQLLRPGHRGRADPARPDPGRLGAPVHPPQATARSRSPTRIRGWKSRSSARWASRCSRSS